MQFEGWENKNSLQLEFTRLTLVFADIAIALRLPIAYPLKKWKSLAILLEIGMPLIWISTGAVIYFSLDISFGLAILIASSTASTDPVVASTIVAGEVAEKNLPGRKRHIISGESGSNDGAALSYSTLADFVIYTSCRRSTLTMGLEGFVVADWIHNCAGGCNRLWSSKITEVV